jgi:hypothetical protein
VRKQLHKVEPTLDTGVAQRFGLGTTALREVVEELLSLHGKLICVLNASSVEVALRAKRTRLGQILD